MPKKINIPIDIISRHFHLPIDDAAQVLGACVTVLKKTCRKHGSLLETSGGVADSSFGFAQAFAVGPTSA